MALRYKVVLFGPPKTGKSCLVNHLLGKPFTNLYIPTLGFDVFHINTKTLDGTSVILDIWDLAGQKAFSGLGDGYFIDADVGIYVFDTENKNSYESFEIWKQQFQNIVGEKVPILICGNKADVHTILANGYIRINARTGFNVEYLLYKVVESISN
jgi:small GTP-binding protein